MIQFANLPDLEIKKNIRQRMESDYDFEQDLYFDDIAKIGAFLSSELRCVTYSKVLNDELVAYAKRNNVFKTMTKGKLIGSRDTLSKPAGFGSKTIDKTLFVGSDDEFELSVARHKHHKVLSGFLSEFEAKNEFNKGSYNFESKDKIGNDVTLTTTPNKAVTLPGFAPPSTFRQSLLGKARHFKDPSVGTLHGEYTHRIQWYLICAYAEATNSLVNSPADIFMACARPEFVGKKTSVWDLVFEGSYGAKDFRKPEAVTEYFLRVSTNKSHPQHNNLWFLSGLVEGRYAKREIEKANA